MLSQEAHLHGGAVARNAREDASKGEEDLSVGVGRRRLPMLPMSHDHHEELIKFPIRETFSTSVGRSNRLRGAAMGD